jgi:TatD DNase family protein
MLAEPLFVTGKGREIVAPDFGGVSVADTHAHLDMLEDPALALANAARAGIAFVATVADPSEDALRTYSELASWLEGAAGLLGEGTPPPGPALPRVRVILGVHPHNAKEFSAAAEAVLREYAADPLTCAVGEIGLDYHYDYSPRDVQRAVFRRQLEIAHELSLPAVVHLREAHGDGERILADVGVPPAGCILHCYNLGAQQMQTFLAMGCYVSFAGPVTFNKSDEIRAAAALVPADRLLTETDCPFMAPEPFRGRKNEPAYTVFTAAKIAEARGEELPAFAQVAFDNAVRVLDQERS